MFRIDTPTAKATLETPEPAATPGFFTNGDPLMAEAPTIPSADWFNAVQEELGNAIEGSGLTLDKGDRAQLLRAILRLGDGSGLQNLAINPTFTIEQRAGLLAGAGNQASTTEGFLRWDRWLWKCGTGDVMVGNRTTVPFGSEETPSKCKEFLDIDKTGTSSATKPTMATRLPDLTYWSGRPVVFAFDAKKIAGSDFTFDGAEAILDFGSGGSPSADVPVELTPLSSMLVTTGWRRYVFGATLPTILGKTLTFRPHVLFRLRWPGNTAFRLGLTGVTVARTSQDPGFVERPPWLERLLCCQFYEVHGETFASAGYVEGLWDTALAFTGNAIRTLNRKFRATKTAIPNMTWYAIDDTSGAVTEGSATNHAAGIGGADVEQTGYPVFSSPPAAGLRYLRAKFVADAELA